QLLKQYRLMKALGQGAQGKVYLCVDMATSRPAAIKSIKKPRGVSLALSGGDEKNISRLMKSIATEVAIMKKLAHENIVALYEVIDDPSADKVFIVMEYVGCGPCLTLAPKTMTCEPLAPEVARAYFRNVLSGLECMHRHLIAHRDIKPDNLLKMSDGEAFLFYCLFDVHLTFTDRLRAVVQFAAKGLRAPEDSQFSPYMADVWALGVTLYVFAFGKLPFTGVNAATVAQKILTSPVTFPTNTKPDARLMALITRMLDKAPANRPSALQVSSTPPRLPNPRLRDLS
ncbi:kinase-like domain-containing protein, partial [Pavlovales sp. CCMP2436]